MKYLIVIPLFALIRFSCGNDKQSNNQQNVPDAAKISADSSNYTTIQWLDSVQNIGVLNFGEKANIKFRFKNSGNKPLYVISAIAGCGCTVADYPKEPITAGNEGVILAEFDTNKAHEGEFKKSITIATNTNPTTSHTVYFSGVVKTGEK